MALLMNMEHNQDGFPRGRDRINYPGLGGGALI